MRPARIIASSVLVLLACAVFFAAHYWSQVRTAEKELNRISRDLASAKAMEGRLEARLAEFKKAFKATESVLADKGKAGAGRKNSDWLERLRSDPVVQARFSDYQKSGLIMVYGPLFRELHLSAEQVARFEAIVIQRSEAQMDLNAAIQDQGISWDDPAAQKMFSQIRADFQNSMTDLLGEAASKQVDTYDQEIPSRSALAGFAGVATLDGIPLSPDQVQRMTSLAAQTRLGPGGPDWNNIMTQAGSILTPNQLELFKTGEFSGPGGYGSQYMARLNYAITLADQADTKAGIAFAPANQEKVTALGPQ